MDKTEWLNERKKGIGGSDIGAIMGVNHWKSPLDVFIDKTTDTITELNSESVYWGNKLENFVAERFAEVTGKKVRRCNQILKHKEYPFFYANVDRLVVGEDAILECKTTNQYNDRHWEDNNIPDSYLLQCQWYMFVLDKPKSYIACLIGGQKFVWKEVLRNKDLIEIMKLAALDFWENNVLKNDPPDVDERSSKAICALYPEANGKEIDVSEIETLISDVEKVKQDITDLKAYEEALRNKIKMFMKDNEVGTCNKYRVLFKNQSKTSVDTKLLKSERPEVFKKYSRITNTRFLRIKKED